VVEKKVLSIISPTRDTSREKRDLYVKITETDKRKEFTESDETSLLIYKEKHIGEINYKALLREEKVNTFFFSKTEGSFNNHEISSSSDGFS